MSICYLGNFASHYRKSIFLAMDKEFDIDWYFGNKSGDIKLLDTKLLNNAQTLQTIWIKGAYLLKNASKLTSKYDTIIMLGEPACISSWTIMLKNKLLFRNKKIYLWTHGWYGKESKLKKIIKKFYFKLASGIFTYGNYARKLMIKEGFKEDSIWTIHNSLNYEEQLNLRNSNLNSDIYNNHFSNDNNTLIFIGRLTPVKRLDLIIEALALLKERGESYNLVFVGDGEQRSALEELAKHKKLNNVWFYGACYDEKTNAELIYNADLCVAPGNVGLTAMHTMVFGTPVATHNDYSYQMPEFEAIHEGKTGIFFNKNDVKDIAYKISDWFKTHQGNREKIRQACYNEIDNYWTPEFQIDVLKKVIK